MIKGVHSAIIWTENLDALKAFYRDKIGFEPEFDSPGFVMFKSASGGQIALGAHSEVKGKSKEPVRVMVNFEVDDIEAEHKRLSAAGVNFVREPGIDPADGVTIATFTDPDGNTLQLFQMPA